MFQVDWTKDFIEINDDIIIKRNSTFGDWTVSYEHDLLKTSIKDLPFKCIGKLLDDLKKNDSIAIKSLLDYAINIRKSNLLSDNNWTATQSVVLNMIKNTDSGLNSMYLINNFDTLLEIIDLSPKRFIWIFIDTVLRPYIKPHILKPKTIKEVVEESPTNTPKQNIEHSEECLKQFIAKLNQPDFILQYYTCRKYHDCHKDPLFMKCLLMLDKFSTNNDFIATLIKE
jgi:hypothetical protein